MVRSGVVASLCLLAHALAVKVKVVMHSSMQEDSRVDEDEGAAGSARPDPWEQRRKRIDVTMLPFLKRHEKSPGGGGEVEEGTRSPLHPNDLLFPLIYKQSHINSMFKFGENWYTWSTEKRTDGSRALNYYICYDEPRHCDDVGWERTDSVPKCAFEIDSVLPDDRACLNAFGVEPRAGAGGGGGGGGALCDGGDQTKVSEVVSACGPRVRSLWRFVRVGRRPPAAAKPADVNSLLCEDEEECFLTVEYRIHHDRITFSLHEPTRGQTFKSVLKREQPAAVEEVTEARGRGHAHGRRGGAAATRRARDGDAPRSKFHPRVKTKPAEGKGVLKERNDSGYNARRAIKNKIKIRDDVSEDFSPDN